MLSDLYGMDDSFCKEIDTSIKKNCKKIQDVQTYMYQFQAFTQDIMMLTGNLMKFKLRMPSFFKKAMYSMTEKTVNDIFNKMDYKDAGVMKKRKTSLKAILTDLTNGLRSLARTRPLRRK